MAKAFNLEKAIEEIRAEFIESALERLDSLEAQSFSATGDADELRLELFREMHSLKGSGASFALQSVSLIAHQFEDYLSASRSVDDQFLEDITKFIDALRTVFLLEEELGTDALSKVLRGLPFRKEVDLDVESPLEIEILLVSPSQSARQILARDLRACGYGIMAVDNPWKALELSVCSQPDMVITSVVMDGMDGVDLANALNAIAPTRQLPVAVLTSFAVDHPVFERLPTGTPIIRSGKHFQGDLADALGASGIA